MPCNGSETDMHVLPCFAHSTKTQSLKCRIFLFCALGLCYVYEHLYSPQQMVAITTYLQHKQWETKRKKEHMFIVESHLVRWFCLWLSRFV